MTKTPLLPIKPAGIPPRCHLFATSVSPLLHLFSPRNPRRTEENPRRQRGGNEEKPRRNVFRPTFLRSSSHGFEEPVPDLMKEHRYGQAEGERKREREGKGKGKWKGEGKKETYGLIELFSIARFLSLVLLGLLGCLCLSCWRR